jgi:hypothetical protein
VDPKGLLGNQNVSTQQAVEELLQVSRLFGIRV